MFVVPNKVAHSVIWVFLLVMGVVLTYTLDRTASLADQTNVNLQVGNAVPVVETHTFTADGVAKNDGDLVAHDGSVNFVISGTIRDDNGDTITSVSGKIYREGVGSGCALNISNCGALICNTIANPDLLRTDYTCSQSLSFMVDNTVEEEYSGGPNYSGEVWRFYVEGSDGTDSGSDSSSNFELGTRIALDETNPDFAMDFGSVAPNTTSGDTTVDIQNKGNVRIDINVSGTDSLFSCTGGETFSRANLHFKEFSTAYGSMNTLSGTPFLISGWDENKEYDLTWDNKPLYWRLYIPPAISAGVCTYNNINITAQKG